MPTSKDVYLFGNFEIDLLRREFRAGGVQIPMGGRSFEILDVLVRAGGELVSKDDLMAEVWPGAIVEENTLQVHISAVRRALGPERGLLKTSFGRGYRLLGEWAVRDDGTHAPTGIVKTPATPPLATNLPLSLSKLIGRDEAVRELLDLVSAYRVVTLTGTGGIGKTALALEVARRLMPDFPGDVRLIELVSLVDPRLVPSAVVSILNLKLGPDLLSAEAVARGIGNRSLLLVFDNCEHVIDAVAVQIEAIVRTCPRVSIFATSRELLRIDGEYAYRVQPLDVPSEDTKLPSDLLAHSAVQLFTTRTKALGSPSAGHDEDLAAVAAVCRRLDGIPLAIEFAAARAATLGLSQVLASFDDFFDSLTSARRIAVPRHQTLRSVLDWSYELLPKQEQRLLRVLSVFSGGFNLEAVLAVSRAGDLAATSEGIANLVGKSLVALDQFGTTSRWRLLETTRMYALEKLKLEGEAESTARQHAEFFRDLVTQKSEARPSPANFALYGREVGNVRAALDWAFSPGGEISVGAVLVAAYAPVWLYLSSMGECGQQVERALSLLDDQSSETARLRMELYIALGLILAYTVAMEEKTDIVLTKALKIAEQLDDVHNQLLTIWSLWNLRLKNGDHRQGMQLAERFLEVSRRSVEPVDILVGERLVGTSLHSRGDQRGARRHLESVIENYATPTNERHSTWYLYDLRMVTCAQLARILALQGRIQQARQKAQESLDISERLQSPLSTLFALRYAAGSVAFFTGDFAKAERYIERLVNISTKFNILQFLKQGRYIQGMLRIKDGEFATGIEMLRSGLDANMESGGWSLCYPEALGVLAEGYAGQGNFVKALRTVEDALDWSDQKGERWFDAELLRIKGTLLLQDPRGRNEIAAEENFLHAIRVAKHHGALLWELRATLNLARLRIVQDKLADARSMLAPVYDQFAEGFDTPDLISAREIMDGALL